MNSPTYFNYKPRLVTLDEEDMENTHGALFQCGLTQTMRDPSLTDCFAFAGALITTREADVSSPTSSRRAWDWTARSLG